MKRQYPTITQANALFFFTAVITFVGSIFFQPIVGFGANLWINEFIYILLPPILIVRLSKWSEEDIFRFKKTSVRNNIISVFSGISLWFFINYINILISSFFDKQVGTFLLDIPDMSIQQSLFYVIGTVVLAPICEEILFRGFIQRAYEGRFKKYGFVITGVIFGYLHILNGISDVIPVSILGIFLGYLVYKTDSISTSMIFHAMTNLSSVLFAGALRAKVGSSIPLWFHILSIAGLLITLILFKCLKAEPKSDEATEAVVIEKRVSVAAVILLVISAVYLTSIGLLEVLSRLDVI